jgi:transglutaminase-like putative cysteine protease
MDKNCTVLAISLALLSVLLCACGNSVITRERNEPITLITDTAISQEPERPVDAAPYADEFDYEPPLRTEAPPAADTLEDYLLTRVTQHSEDIDVSAFHIPSEEMGDIFFAFMARHPEIFYLTGEIAWSEYGAEGVRSLQPTYTAGIATVQRQIAQLQAALESAYRAIPTGLSPRETVAAVNDWLCINAEYDETMSDYSAYDLLVNGTGVCEAYTAAFGIFMNHYDIPYRKIESEAMDHTWSQVFLDGAWLHVDVTWNDPVPDEYGRALRDYLFLTDEELMAMPKAHYNWTYWEANNALSLLS